MWTYHSNLGYRRTRQTHTDHYQYSHWGKPEETKSTKVANVGKKWSKEKTLEFCKNKI